MFIRLTFCKFLPGTIREARRIYNEEIVPAVRRQKGNISIRLLEPADKADDYVSVSEWKTRADADAYEASGAYKKMIAKLEGFFLKQPELKKYSVEEIQVLTDYL